MRLFKFAFTNFAIVAVLFLSCTKSTEKGENPLATAPQTTGKIKVKLNNPLPNGATEIEIDASIKAGPVESLSGISTATVASGDIQQIPLPDESYTSSTTLISLAELSNYETYSSVSNGEQTITFNPSVTKGAVGINWSTWSEPPYSETATPLVLTSATNTMELTLSQSSTTFGFELEPNAFETFNFKVDLYAGSTVVGSLIEAVDGFRGARLFAATTVGQAFNKVVISTLNGEDAGGFAIANVRYSPVKTVEIDVMPRTCPNVFNLTSKGLLPVAILGTSNLDVRNIDLSTLKLQGVAPTKPTIEDVSSPVANRQSTCDCNISGADGSKDLSLKFDRKAIAIAIGAVGIGSNVTLTLTGKMKDGTPIKGQDCVIIAK